MEQEPNQKIIYKNFYSISYIKLILILLLSYSNTINLYSQTLSAEQIYEKVKDAVVVILAYDYADELAAQGSGVVLNDKGYVVTNYHVLSGNERLEIMHGDEIIPYVDIIGIDVEKDILILKIEEKKFPSVKLGDATKLKVGQRVYAIGSPLGFENTLSEGIISGLRSYAEINKNYIQITASISPGSSGGAVVNDKGELIGISTSTIEEGQNLNFAIPIDEVLNVNISSYGKDESFQDFELYHRGLVAANNRNFIEAIEYYSEFLELYPNDYRAYNNRGASKAKLGYYDDAIRDFDKVIDLNPNDINAYYNRGLTKNQKGEYISALKDFDKVIEINPDIADAYNDRGISKKNLEDYESAIQDYNRAIEINPSYSKAYTNRGIAKRKLGDYMGAIKDYSKAIEINPNDADTYINRGIAKYFLDDVIGACLDWSKAGELGDYNAYEIIREYCN
ncbi:MAG TPA: tetratricopeptide repeat protein [Ignavibacteriaceae bacterium]|nr:tetratricopeptide repeat protein [Ignavibacteriaceae bacterium]